MHFILSLALMISSLGQASDAAESRYETHRKAGLIAFLLANYKQAEDDFKDALVEARSLDPFDKRVPAALVNLAVLDTKTGRFTDAEELLQQSVTILQVTDPNHDLCVVLNSLGQVYLSQN